MNPSYTLSPPPLRPGLYKRTRSLRHCAVYVVSKIAFQHSSKPIYPQTSNSGFLGKFEEVGAYTERWELYHPPLLHSTQQFSRLEVCFQKKKKKKRQTLNNSLILFHRKYNVRLNEAFTLTIFPPQLQFILSASRGLCDTVCCLTAFTDMRGTS